MYVAWQTLRLKEDLAASLDELAANYRAKGQITEAQAARDAARWHAVSAMQMRALLGAARKDADAWS